MTRIRGSVCVLYVLVCSSTVGVCTHSLRKRLPMPAPIQAQQLIHKCSGRHTPASRQLWPWEPCWAQAIQTYIGHDRPRSRILDTHAEAYIKVGPDHTVRSKGRAHSAEVAAQGVAVAETEPAETVPAGTSSARSGDGSCMDGYSTGRLGRDGRGKKEAAAAGAVPAGANHQERTRQG